MQVHHLGAVVAVASVAFLAGCAPGGQAASPRQGSGAQGPNGSAEFGTTKLAQAPNAYGAPLTVNGAGASVTVGVPPSSYIERSVSAAYTVPSGSFLSSFDGVTARAVAIGGYVVSSSTQPDGTGRIVSGAVSLKVPALKIADFLNGMPSAFTASSINFDSVDHTAGFIDVNARLGSSRAHLAALNTLLARATTLADITNLQEQIATVQTQIDTGQGQLNVLAASVDLATATVQLRERGSASAPLPPPNPVTSGIGGGWSNAAEVTGAVLEGAVSSLPLIALALLAWLLWKWGFRGATPWRRARAAE